MKLAYYYDTSSGQNETDRAMNFFLFFWEKESSYEIGGTNFGSLFLETHNLENNVS